MMAYCCPAWLSGPAGTAAIARNWEGALAANAKGKLDPTTVLLIADIMIRVAF